MKKLIVAAVVASLLTGCAQRNPDGSHILDENGKEKISWPRTIGLIVGAPILIFGIAAMAKNSNKWATGAAGAGAGYYGGSHYGNNDHPCDHANEYAEDGSICGYRAASFRNNGRNPGFNYGDQVYDEGHEQRYNWN